MPLDLVVVTPEGEFGVLEAHEKFLAPLQHGPMEIKLTNGETEWAAISDGFAEVNGSQVVVLVDECFKAHEIDLEHAQHTQREAAEELAELLKQTNAEEHQARLETAVVRASVHIEVHGRYHT